MSAFRKWTVLALVLGIAGLAPGCIKMKWFMTVYPDGSGKAEVTVGVSKALARLSEMGGEGEESHQLYSEEIVQNSEGIMWTKTKESTDGDFKYTKLTGYFEDINKVKSNGPSFSFQRLEDGSYALSFQDSSVGDEMAGEDNPLGGAKSEEQKQRRRGTMKAMMAGFEVAYGFKMPGEVSEAEGMEVEGRDAELKIDTDKMLEMMDDEKKMAEAIGGKILAKVEGDLSVELAAFQVELAEARIEWEQMKAEEDTKKAEEEGKKESGEGEKEEGGSESE